MLLGPFGLLLAFLLNILLSASVVLPPGHIRHATFFEFNRGLTVTQTVFDINAIYGENSTSERSVRRWFARFRSNETSLEDEPRAGRPPGLNDAALMNLVHQDSRQTTRDLAAQLGVDHSTVVRHLDELGYKSLLGAWVPHALTDHARLQRISISASLLSRYERRSFLPRIVTGDESWILYANIGRKRQWVGPGEKPSPEPKPDLHQKKKMLSVFWDTEGILYWELLRSGTTINALEYTRQLDLLAAAIRTKRPNKKEIILQMDNARPHVAALTRSKIHSLNWEILPHPPYSPDLAPSDYHLFRHLKAEIAGKEFKTEEDLKSWLQEFFDNKPRIFFDRGIRQLPVKWATVVEHNGDYTE